MSEREPMIRLSRDQIDFFHREGYMVLQSITSPVEVEWIKERYDRLFKDRAGRETGEQFDLAGTDEEGKEAVLPQILSPSKHIPEFKETRYCSNALAIAKQLLGPEARFQFDHAILKPARFGAETPWHQDEAYWDAGLNYNAVEFWMPLQPATLENGCMWFLPGSHKGEVRTHHSINHDPRIHGLEAEMRETSGAVPCPIPAGGATLHHQRTLHYTGPNRTDQPRRAYTMGFEVPPTPREIPGNYFWNDQKKTAGRERALRAQKKG